MTGSPLSVPSVCEGSRFVGLWDGKGFKENFQNIISLIEFLET